MDKVNGHYIHYILVTTLIAAVKHYFQTVDSKLSLIIQMTVRCTKVKPAGKAHSWR